MKQRGFHWLQVTNVTDLPYLSLARRRPHAAEKRFSGSAEFDTFGVRPKARRKRDAEHNSQSLGPVMISADEWETLITNAPPGTVVHAQSYRYRFKSRSRPTLLGCSDKHDYVVKSGTREQLLRSICSDQIIGHIAATLGAPVPVVRLVEIPQRLIDGTPEIADVPAGIAHGSRYMKNVSKTRQGIMFENVAENRPRFALLALMYGLAGVVSDHQFFYEDTTNIVWSFDHGHFFPGGPHWTIESLTSAPPVEFDSKLSEACKLLTDELMAAAHSLGRLINDAIAQAVASPQAAWQIVMEERVAMAQYLRSRADSFTA